MPPPKRAPLRVPAAPLQQGLVLLSEEASHYVVRVHRLGLGDPVLLFDPETALEAEGEIVAARPRQVECRVSTIRAGTRCGVSGLHLIQGLGKGDKPEQVVREGVVLGVQSIQFVICERSVVQPTARDAAKHERLTRVAVEAARQCGRSNLPELRRVVRLDEMSHQTRGATVVLQPGGRLPLLEAVLSAGSRQAGVWLCVGPEGGFSDGELERLVADGAKLASLGDLVLRTELAAVVGLARAGAFLSNPAT